MKNAEYWIKKLNLNKHPEGGYFGEIYRSTETVTKSALPKRYSGERSFLTSIYFLITSKDTSNFHRLKSDEIWHFYLGDPLSVHILHKKTGYSRVTLGKDPEQGQVFQAIIKKGYWFGATVDKPDSYSLVGCTVAPGFDFDDFELARREDLLNEFAEYKEIVAQLTKP